MGGATGHSTSAFLPGGRSLDHLYYPADDSICKVSSTHEASEQLDKSAQLPSGSQHSGTSSTGQTQEADFEAKVSKLVELGFGREAVIQALKLFNGNEEQAAGFLFG
ncbi:hypothetical protein Taro_040360, partial [Colocasia esculenta]|nr:hypothetical protein [Colocasia esculenta]